MKQLIEFRSVDVENSSWKPKLDMIYFVNEQDTFSLFVDSPTTSSFTDTACYSYTWNDSTYTASGV